MDQLRPTIRARLLELGLSARQASIRAGLSHNTLRVILVGARPSAETCDALEPVLGLETGALRRMAEWPLDERKSDPDIEYALTLLDQASVEQRQAVLGYLLVLLSAPATIQSPVRNHPG